ncbi:hypothetical protein [Pseudobdellovibrio exovorus]|uniref:Polysaccharide deacetylase n=1 Tax=Pseudobdellovibrio exovorus JSS TaxID=1184267 RepID=M4VAB0_9BACT|nr:hypothetical protein [Pseudobdellovibrio exovorus]AGH95405.1 hypothetical protein A11Q_1189 [Pseudobdellovibrio exovorus JSS]
MGKNLLVFLIIIVNTVFTLAATAKVENYQPVFLDCSRSDAQAFAVAIRQFQQNGVAMSLVVEANSLKTKIARQQDLSCKQINRESFARTYYSQVLQQAAANKAQMANAGVRRVNREQVALTVDMCPSSKAYESRFYDWAESAKAALGVALTAAWGMRHPSELARLKEMSKTTNDITWINHSYYHRYRAGVANAQNFLLMDGTNIDAEVLGNEVFMIENGIVPSVYFRFPGLISSDGIITKILGWGLIPLGSDAWLAKGEAPKAGSIILIHGNGNEPTGITAFFRHLNQILRFGIGSL